MEREDVDWNGKFLKMEGSVGFGTAVPGSERIRRLKEKCDSAFEGRSGRQVMGDLLRPKHSMRPCGIQIKISNKIISKKGL